MKNSYFVHSSFLRSSFSALLLAPFLLAVLYPFLWIIL